MEGFVVGRFPDLYAEGVPLDTEIAAVFTADVDPRTLNDVTFHLTTSAGLLVPSEITYFDRTARLKPKQLLNPGATYRVHVIGCSGEDTYDGLLTITGEPMVGAFTWQFKTITEAPLQAPELLSPGDATLVDTTRPRLSWLAVESASGYEVEVATSQSFFRNTWSSKVNQPEAPVGLELKNGTYYWRVRAFAGDRLSQWSDIWTFTIGIEEAVEEPWEDPDLPGGLPSEKKLVLVEPVASPAPLDTSKVVLIVPAPPEKIDTASISLKGRSYFEDPSIESHGSVEITEIQVEDLGDNRTRITLSIEPIEST